VLAAAALSLASPAEAQAPVFITLGICGGGVCEYVCTCPVQGGWEDYPDVCS
jgi:hypothetical protein